MRTGTNGHLRSRQLERWAAGEMSTRAKLYLPKYYFAPSAHLPRYTFPKSVFAPVPIFPTVHSSEVPNYNRPTAYFTRINFPNVLICHGAHLTSAQLLICPKCPSTTPLEAATANIATQSSQRIGLRM